MIVRNLLTAFTAGVVFAIGLGLSGMTNPEKVVHFLDVTGDWDPSLGLVMAGAIATHLGAAQWALRARKPIWSGAFSFPRAGRIDAQLVAGAALFGIGWGMTGYCPGPALVDLMAPSTSLVVFVAAMVVGMVAFRLCTASLKRADLLRSSERLPRVKTSEPELDRGGLS